MNLTTGARVLGCSGARVLVALVLGALVLGSGAQAQIEMPDPSLIHGRAIPAPELPNGTVTVRLVRENIGNNIAGQSVRVTGGGQTATDVTDDQGRAEFTTLTRGSEARADATVDGEELVSEPFTVPASGGLRVILVSGMKEAAARREQEAAAGAAAPAVRGQVVIGRNSRVLIEFQNDTLNVFYVLDIVNNAQSPVDIGGPLLIQLPNGAGGAAVMEGSSANASIDGETLTVLGPFAPGSTLVQAAFVLRHDSPELTLTQSFPVPLEEVSVAVEKLGALSIASPQFATVRDVQSDNGTPFALGNGPALAAGNTLTVQLSGLPSHPRTAQYVALGLAAIILATGGWFAFAGRHDAATVRRRLIERRDTLLGELTALEERRRKGGNDSKYASRRQRIMSELEQIYGELDEAA